MRQSDTLTVGMRRGWGPDRINADEDANNMARRFLRIREGKQNRLQGAQPEWVTARTRSRAIATPRMDHIAYKLLDCYGSG
ncbi:MAG: hypothetical protein D6791_12385 [Chloroflexi bacterium]|nr:MAG: hypothetical protein D6791_12385 [Chloroflexota bacterium]